MNCEIPVPDATAAGQYIDASGKIVPPGAKDAFPGAPRPFTGEEVKRAFRGRSLPGTTYDQLQAYLQYIRRLQAGPSGFTFFAPIQMPPCLSASFLSRLRSRAFPHKGQFVKQPTP